LRYCSSVNLEIYLKIMWLTEMAGLNNRSTYNIIIRCVYDLHKICRRSADCMSAFDENVFIIERKNSHNAVQRLRSSNFRIVPRGLIFITSLYNIYTVLRVQYIVIDLLGYLYKLITMIIISYMIIIHYTEQD